MLQCHTNELQSECFAATAYVFSMFQEGLVLEEFQIQSH